MKIGLISDTHGSLQGWQKALSGPLNGADLILHAGDVLYHGPRNPLPEGYGGMELAQAINGCDTPILIARGNCDSEVDQMVIDLPMQSPYVYTQTKLGTIFVTHGHHYSPERCLALAKQYKVDFWISGHTHVPFLERQEGVVFINPGSPSLPKGSRLRKSVGLITEKEVQLIDIDSGEVYQRLGGK